MGRVLKYQAGLFNSVLISTAGCCQDLFQPDIPSLPKGVFFMYITKHRICKSCCQLKVG